VNPLDAGIIGTSLVTVACTGGNLFAVLRGKPGLAGAFCVLAGVSQLILAVLDALGGGADSVRLRCRCGRGLVLAGEPPLAEAPQAVAPGPRRKGEGPSRRDGQEHA
jgi:hypothetical protein